MPRGLPDSVIHDEAAVLARVRRLLADGTVTTSSGHAPDARALDPAARRHARARSTLARAVRGVIERGRRPHRADLAAAGMSWRVRTDHKGGLSHHSQSVLAPTAAPHR